MIDKRDEIKRARTCLIERHVIKRDYRDQHQQAAEKRKNKEFDRRVNTVIAAPDADQEKHRHERRFEKQIKNQQVERHKNADHRAFKQQHEHVKCRRPLFDRMPASKAPRSA